MATSLPRSKDVEIEGAEAIEADIRQVVGGHFTQAALGPVYADTIARVRARAADYLSVFEAMFLGARFDAVTQSRWHLPSFLELLADEDRERMRATAAVLLRMYDAVMHVPDDVDEAKRDELHALLSEDTLGLLERLDQRRAMLRYLVGLPPLPPPPPAATPPAGDEIGP